MFGVVVKAWATGIKKRLEDTEVAVKMIEDGAGNEVGYCGRWLHRMTH